VNGGTGNRSVVTTTDDRLPATNCEATYYRPPLVEDLGLLRELTRTLPATLGLAPRLCYVLLAGHANTQAVAWPSHTTLAAEMGVDAKTAWRCLRTLRQSGLLVVTPGSGRRSSIYRFVDYRDIHTLRATADPQPHRGSALPRRQPPRQRDRGSAPPRREVLIEGRIEERAPTRPPWLDAGVTAAEWSLRNMGRL